MVTGTHDPREIALTRERTEQAWKAQHQRERRQQSATKHPLPAPVMLALVFAYIDLCHHHDPANPWPRNVDKFAFRSAKAQCPRDLHTHIVNATRAQLEYARAIALEAWFPAMHGKKPL